MSVSNYELDRIVFQLLNEGSAQLRNWQGASSGIADYVASWGVERFWAMSRSQVLLDGNMPSATQGSEEERRYFAWGVARAALCQILGADLQINAQMTTAEFQERFRELNLNQQALLIDMLIEVASTVQFWTMRIKNANDANTPA